MEEPQNFGNIIQRVSAGDEMYIYPPGKNKGEPLVTIKVLRIGSKTALRVTAPVTMTITNNKRQS